MISPDGLYFFGGEILEKTRALASLLTENSLIHNDLKPCNLLIQGDSPVLIDLDSMRKHREGPYFRLRYQKMIDTFHRRLDGKKS